MVDYSPEYATLTVTTASSTAVPVNTGSIPESSLESDGHHADCVVHILFQVNPSSLTLGTLYILSSPPVTMACCYGSQSTSNTLKIVILNEIIIVALLTPHILNIRVHHRVRPAT